MDVILRNLKRKAESSGEWEAYARALERAYGLAEPKLYAVLTNDDTFGDSIWNGGYPVPYQEGDDELTLSTRYAKAFFRESCDECLDFTRKHGMGYYCSCLECEDCKAIIEYENSGHMESCSGDLELYVGMIPTQAWVIDEATAFALQTAGKIETCTDSAYYQLNSGLKSLAKMSALKTVNF